MKNSFGCSVKCDQYKNTKQIFTAIQKDNETRIHTSLDHKALSSSLSSLMQALKLVVFGLQRNRAYPKTFSTIQLNILTTLLLQGKISVNGPSLSHLHALSASRLNLFKTLSLAASRTLKMAVTLGAITQFFSILQTNFPRFQTARYICRSSIFFISKLNHR